MPVGSIQSEPATCPKCSEPVAPPKRPATEITCPNGGTLLKLDTSGTLVVVENA